MGSSSLPHRLTLHVGFNDQQPSIVACWLQLARGRRAPTLLLAPAPASAKPLARNRIDIALTVLMALSLDQPFHKSSHLSSLYIHSQVASDPNTITYSFTNKTEQT